ncbi:amidohydrolase family protein [Glycomyces arizonensis]|uniref:amidohydrolase family protein n=1 Tax=Glycomyces arizonensis TaxID=256035 RepID=UPI000405837A|nr:amidohydrolase family protein [Glycomyces arizonensis]
MPLTAACEGTGSDTSGTGGAALLANAVVFDGERFTEHDSVAIRDGMVAEVGRGLDGEGLEVFDCGGRVLLPGLIDAHAHSSTVYAAASLRFGVTAMLDMHGEADADAREARTSLDESPYADIWFAGWGMTVPGGHPTQITPDAPVVEGLDDVAGFVEDRFAAGADYLKLFIAGTGEMPTLDQDQATAAAAAAHARNRLAVAHVSTWEDALTAARADVDVLAHLPVGEAVSQEAVELMAERRIPVVATLTVASPARCEHDATRFLDPDHPVAERLDRLQERDAERVFEFCAVADLEWWRDRTDASIEAVRSAGVELLVGTDLSNAPTIAGVSVHHEMELLAGAGLSTEEVLSGATSKTADVFGLDDRGRIAEGRRGDLVLFDTTDPDRVIGSYGVAAVWKNGHPVALAPPT